jgi:hypothetical protein
LVYISAGAGGPSAELYTGIGAASKQYGSATLYFRKL